MIVGVGIDLVPVPRMAALLARRSEGSVRRLFTEAEISRCEAGPRRAESLAARFAAKEAFFKALGTGWGRGGGWTEVEVVTEADGRPTLRLHGLARTRSRERGVLRAHLSLTHTAEVAGAYVVLEG